MSATQQGMEGSSVGEEQMTETDIHTLLGNDRRRQTLHYLMQDDHEDPRTIRDISRRVAAWENGCPVEEVTSKERRRVHIALQQTHLPRMDEYRVVDYDADRGTVELSDNAVDLRVYMDVVEEDEIPWGQFYLGLSVLSMGFISAVAADVLPFNYVPELWASVVVSLGFVVTAVLHVRHERRNLLGSDGPPPTSDDGR